jgi:essential nuclear protein 1
MEMVILERVREDIHETKKLNVHLFNCLKRGLYKPAGFFKGMFYGYFTNKLRLSNGLSIGFLFPLAASGKLEARSAQ